MPAAKTCWKNAAPSSAVLTNFNESASGQEKAAAQLHLRGILPLREAPFSWSDFISLQQQYLA
jgi:hypothetical protein